MPSLWSMVTGRVAHTALLLSGSRARAQALAGGLALSLAARPGLAIARWTARVGACGTVVRAWCLGCGALRPLKGPTPLRQVRSPVRVYWGDAL
eukprot:scaffold7863_cov118-Isochrysis_galbana.AAC.2